MSEEIAVRRIIQVFRESARTMKDSDSLLISMVKTYCQMRGDMEENGSAELFMEYLNEMVMKGLAYDALQPKGSSAEI